MDLKHEGIIALALLLLLSAGLEGCAVYQSKNPEWEWPIS